MKGNSLNIALVGNPNCGKSSLFNSLTGLNQKVGNFPGVTVDKKTGSGEISRDLKADIIDLPGTYSLYPKRADEWVTYRVLLRQDKDVNADIIVLLADASNLKRNLLFVSQIIDLKVPVIVALTMMDLAKSKGIHIDIDGLERELGVPVVAVNPRKNKGIPQLKKAIELTANRQYKSPSFDFIPNASLAVGSIEGVKKIFPQISDYTAIHYLINHENFQLTDEVQNSIEQIEIDNKFNHTRTQAEEIMQRYARIRQIMATTVTVPDPLQRTLFTEKLDKILLHRYWGYLILLTTLFVLFQSIFLLAEYPMQAIEWIFAKSGSWLTDILPASWFTDLLVNGLIAGLSGIVVFVPQIMILFGLITLMEDTGYMARISFLTDKVMRKVGLNGKSVMPMISGFACAVPAIMSARNIENKKERLLTILITPLMSCSARLPVYTILIALVIPNERVWGIFGLQGLVMMGLYLFGLVIALFVSYIMKWFINIKEKSFFILELPMYRGPRWRNVGVTMIEKAKIFIVDAGKIIMVVSLILRVLSTYGPPGRMDKVRERYAAQVAKDPSNAASLKHEEAGEVLENSFVGILGKSLQPVIAPLGYDWKIGIALITSLAAREVFVGTMVQLYSLDPDTDDENSPLLRDKVKAATRSDGTIVYSLATGVSLMIFYALAMQCVSTLAIVKRETRSWKVPIFQLFYMTGLAYLFSFIAYQVLK